MENQEGLPRTYWPIMVVCLLYFSAVGGLVAHEVLGNAYIGIVCAALVLVGHEAWSLRRGGKTLQLRHSLVNIGLVVGWLVVSLGILGLFGVWADTASTPADHDAILIGGFGIVLVGTVLYWGFLAQIGRQRTATFIRFLLAAYLVWVVARSIL